MRGRILTPPAMGFNRKWQITLELDEQPSFYDRLKDKDISVEIKKYSEKRSLNANAYFHTLVGQIAAIQRLTHTEVHNRLIADYGVMDEQINNIPKEQKSHGFGLLNCKGIIEKYKKVSSLFSVCEISAESHHGKGSTFRFRLPKGFVRFILLLCMVMTSMYSMAKGTSDYGKKAALFADSAYFSNIEGTYDRTLVMADSARKYLNLIYF